MTRVVKRLNLRIPQVLLVISFTVGLLLAPASAQTNNTLSLLQQYQAAVAKVREAASKRLGPYQISANAEAGRVLAVQQEIKAGNGPTDQQRQTLAQALQDPTGILDS